MTAFADPVSTACNAGRNGRAAAIRPRQDGRVITDDLRRAVSGDAAAVLRFAGALAELDRTGTEADGRVALALLAPEPRLLTRLDEARRSWRVSDPTGHVARLVARFDGGARTPIAVALAALDADGHRRERAVRAVIAAGHPELVPFLVLRTGDWVRQVSSAARHGLTGILDAASVPALSAAAPITRHLAGRRRGRFAEAQLTAAVLAASPAVRDRLARSRSVLERRLAFAADRLQDRLSQADLAVVAARESDSIIRSAAAGVVCRDAVWRADTVRLRALAGVRWSDVRALALTGLVRLGRDAEVAQLGLDDTSALVRAAARAAARRAGIDVEAHYRAAAPSAGAIAGLAEVGTAKDAELLRPLLRHGDARVRAAAVKASGVLSAVPVDEVVPLLQDPAAAVVREATAALRPCLRLLPDGLGEQLMAGARPEVRMAGYRLILAGRDGAARGAAARRLAADDDPRLARRGRHDLRGHGRFGPMA